jgi:hypothetical protein
MRHLLLFVLSLGITLTAFTVGATSTPVTGASVTAASELPFEKPLRIDFEQREIPFGYQRVAIHVESSKQAQALWLRATGSMNGYSLENANKLTFVSRLGTAPCSCMLIDEFRAYYYGELPNVIPDCRPQCPGE